MKLNTWLYYDVDQDQLKKLMNLVGYHFSIHIRDRKKDDKLAISLVCRDHNLANKIEGILNEQT